jgi:A/G-specific adenine glycosylase
MRGGRERRCLINIVLEIAKTVARVLGLTKTQRHRRQPLHTAIVFAAVVIHPALVFQHAGSIRDQPTPLIPTLRHQAERRSSPMVRPTQLSLALSPPATPGGAMSPWPERLLAWFAVAQRPMPWRGHADPYAIWLSEVMLQQTQVDTVRPYFARFLARFPTAAALAQADIGEVLKMWEGLGYYTRARSLHQAAKAVVTRHGGQLPRTLAELRELPGFGPYTAGAVASIAFGLPTPAVDGNVMRVLARYWGIAQAPSTLLRDELETQLLPILAEVSPSQFNQALMELGALICRPRQALCHQCPLAGDCQALAQDRVAELPLAKVRQAVPHHAVVVALLWRGQRVLVQRRPANKLLGGLWEFPGGKLTAGEEPRAGLAKRCLAELGLSVTARQPLPPVRHAFTHFKITVQPWQAELAPGEPRPLASDEVRWVTLDEAAALPFSKVGLRILSALRKLSEAGGLPA